MIHVVDFGLTRLFQPHLSKHIDQLLIRNDGWIIAKWTDNPRLVFQFIAASRSSGHKAERARLGIKMNASETMATIRS
jgi:hypothetical protein